MADETTRHDGQGHPGNFRALPAVGALLQRPTIGALVAEHGRAIVTQAARECVDQARERLSRGEPAAVTDDDIARRAAQLARGTLVPVINATGVIVHTNLGRAPLAEEALALAVRAASGYATLEYDLASGERGDRHVHARQLLTALTGAEDALVVNNNAAAVLLALAACARGREVIVSRGELIEIGGSFRVPDVLAQSGARLVEVGTTNRTHLRDYARAVGEDTAILLKVHPSNFAITGFTAEVGIAELAGLAREKKLGLFYDAGSGCMPEMAGPSGEVPVAEHLRAGADVVAFSGDKLLGGPQAGILVGKSEWIGKMRQHPLFRALRADKLCVAALSATLALWRDAPEKVPVLRMALAPIEELEARARALAARVSGDVVASVGRLGGGSAPARELEGRAVRVKTTRPDALAARLRAGDPPVIARIEGGHVLFNLRAVSPSLDGLLATLIERALAAP